MFWLLITGNIKIGAFCKKKIRWVIVCFPSQTCKKTVN